MRGVFSTRGKGDCWRRGFVRNIQTIQPILGNFLVGVSICILTCAAVFAQATGQISGRVTDATGAVLPGVEVTLTRSDTGLVRSTVTNELGVYAFPSLLVGPYRLEAALSSFRTFVQSGIVVQVNANLVIDAALQVGQITDTVEVQANSDIQVETRSMGVGTLIENQRILELPLPARQVTDLITLSGAAVQVSSGAVGSMVTGVNISVAGGGDFGIQHKLDGALHNNRFFESNMPMPFPDALAEFRVNTSAQDASESVGHRPGLFGRPSDHHDLRSVANRADGPGRESASRERQTGQVG